MAGWNVIGTTPDNGSAPPKAPAASQWKVTKTEPDEMGLGRQLLGNAEIAGSTVANIPYGLAHAAHDIYNKVTGNLDAGPGWEEHIHVPTGAAGQELSTALGNSLTETLDKVPGSQEAITKGVGAVNEAGEEPGTVGHFAKHVVAPIAGDVAAIAGARVPLQNAVRSGFNAVRESAAAATGAGTPWKAAGYRNGGGHPIARQVADESGKEALTLQNQEVGNTIGSAEAGHPQGQPMSYESLADARAEPNAVWNRTANALPTQELPAEVQQAINNAAKLEKVSTLTEADQQRVAKMAQRMTEGPRTGQQVIEDMRTLRQEGFKRAASEDVDQQNIGKAQLDMARALEGYVGKALPPNADVSLEQFQQARKALAKNWTVQEALRGSDIDQQAIARMQRADPELLDGGLKVMADFANGEGREVTSLPNRYNPPSVFRDAAGVVNIHRPVQSTLQGIPGVGSTARRFLTGSRAEAIDRAKSMFPGRPPGQFAPLPSAQLPGGKLVRPGDTGPVGSAGVGTGANPNPAAQAPLGDLATVMSEGVEQRPSPGLSVGPMGAPQGEGLPFRASPEVVGAKPVQGGAPPLKPRIQDDYGNEVNPNVEPREPIKLGDRFARGAQPEDRPASVLAERPTVPNPNAEPSLGDLLADLQDYAKVKSQGVPEGTAAKAGPRTGPSRPWLVDEHKPGNDRGFENLMEDIHGEEPLSNNASGQTDVSQEFANWQTERRAAGVTRHRFDPETEEMVPMHSTSARDPQSIKGRPVFDRDAKGNYTVVDRGGLSPSAIKGIIARMTRLGDVF